MNVQKIKFYLLLLVPLLSLPTPARAQEKQKEMSPAESRLRAIFNQMTGEKEASETGQKDPVNIDDLSNLPNPFLPQLPAETVAEIPKPPGRLPPRPELPPPPGAAPEGPQTYSFTLSGLIWNTDLPQAIINGQVVKEGDQIDLWTVQNISRQGVELMYNDETVLVKP